MREFNLANEQALIVAALKNQDFRKRIVATIESDDFGGVRHQNIFDVIRAMGNSEIDKHTILSMADDVGGHEYLDKLYSLDVPADIDNHLDMFYQYAARVKALKKIKESVEIFEDPTYDYEDYKQIALDVVRTLRDPAYKISIGKDASKEYQELMEKRWSGKSSVFVSTCIPIFDEYLVEGLAPGRIVVVCGRTRHGKSAFALELIYRQLKSSNKKIMIEALEVGRTKFIDQLIAKWTGISYFDIVRKSVDMGLKQRKMIKNAIEEIFNSGRLTVIDLDVYRDVKKYTNDAVLDRFEQFVVNGEFDIVVSDMFERKLFRRDIDSISSALIREQQMVKRYDYCSVLVHQLKRFDKNRKDRRPQLDDLYGSGYWEQCADIVLGVYRDKVYYPFLQDDKMEISILKQKSGSQDQNFVAVCDMAMNWLDEFRLKTIEDESYEPKFPRSEE